MHMRFQSQFKTTSFCSSWTKEAIQIWYIVITFSLSNRQTAYYCSENIFLNVEFVIYSVGSKILHTASKKTVIKPAILGMDFQVYKVQLGPDMLAPFRYRLEFSKNIKYISVSYRALELQLIKFGTYFASSGNRILAVWAISISLARVWFPDDAKCVANLMSCSFEAL